MRRDLQRPGRPHGSQLSSCRGGPVAWLLCLLAAVTGCAQPRLQPDPGLPEPARLEDGVAVMPDGYRLPYWRWLPRGRPHYVVLGLHGFNEYRIAFAATATRLAARGHAVYAMDQRGFGETAHRGLWPPEGRLAEDVRVMARLIRQRHPGRPMVLLGISMGAAVALLAQTGDPPAPADALVLSAPAVWGRRTMNPFMRAGLWLMVHTAPGSTWTGEKLDIRPTDNLALLRAMARDPLVIKETRADALWGLTGLMDRALDAAHALDRPVLVLHGGRDQVIPRRSVCRLIERLAGADAPVRVRFYPEGHHMLMRDLAGEQVVADIAGWLEAGPPGPPLAGWDGCGEEPPDRRAAGSDGYRSGD